MKHRVVITGIGAITPLGSDVPSLWQGLLAGKSGIGRISRFDSSPLPVHIAGEIKNYQSTERLDPKFVRHADRFTQYALWAALEAVNDARIDFSRDDAYRVGVVVGTGMGGVETWDFEQTKFLTSINKSRVSPFLVPMMIPDMAAGQIAIHFKIRGPNFCTVSACASGAQAIGEAFRIIKNGYADVILAGGSEAPIQALSIASFGNMRALSRRNDEPERASRPFDRDRDGFVIAEGAGIVLLETLEHAQNRGAQIYGEIVGYGATVDAYHITAPMPSGESAAMAMKLALDEAELAPEGIDYINAHGTSTGLNDVTETKAIKQIFSAHAYKLPISSTKSMIGHLLGGAGGVEFIVTTLSVYHGQIHPTANYEHPDPECDLDYVPGAARTLTVNAALSNSFGFGGHNVTLAVKRFAVSNSGSNPQTTTAQ